MCRPHTAKINAHAIAHTNVHLFYAHLRVSLRMPVASCVEPQWINKVFDFDFDFDFALYFIEIYF